MASFPHSAGNDGCCRNSDRVDGIIPASAGMTDMPVETASVQEEHHDLADHFLPNAGNRAIA